MKKLLLPLFILMSFNLVAQPWKTINGDGNLKKETRHVSDFTSLFSRGPMDVQINYGTSNSITVQADENLLQYIDARVENGKLIIQPRKNINLKSHSKIIVYVSMTKINTLQLSGSGNINGSGAFENDGETNMMVSGSGNIKVNSGNFEKLGLYVSGSGNIDLKGGSANELNVAVSGSGNIDCSNVPTENAEVKISGSGNAKVNASKSVSANISGSGNVFYKGEPDNISTKVMGSGKAIKI